MAKKLEGLAKKYKKNISTRELMYQVPVITFCELLILLDYIFYYLIYSFYWYIVNNKQARVKK